MQIIANFSYAGTSKYVTHAVESGRTLCGMVADELIDRVGQEWEYIEEEEYLNITHKHSVSDVGCVKCKRLLIKRAGDGVMLCEHGKGHCQCDNTRCRNYCD